MNWHIYTVHDVIMSAGAVEYCLPETFNVTCAVDEIIMVTSAQYGRMHSGRCIKQNYGHVGCMADVTASVENECSGRRHCQFPVAQLLGVAAPCPTDVTSYLEATHKCVRGQRHSAIVALSLFRNLSEKIIKLNP